MSKKKNKGPKILLLDIETAPLIAYCWALHQQYISAKQLKKNTCVLSWSAKWLDENKVHYMDQRDSKDIENDKKILKKLWSMMNEADIIIGHNSEKFDIKRLNARFAVHELNPVESYKTIDTYKESKKYFDFPSHSLDSLAKELKLPNKKLQHAKYPGFELWKQCLNGNISAWNEMKTYNKMDVLVLEDLYHKIRPWSNKLNFNVFYDDEENVCSCGSTEFKKKGFAYTATSKFQRYVCKECGAQTRGRKNLLSKDKMKKMRTKIS